jgi:hypothetical protein
MYLAQSATYPHPYHAQATVQETRTSAQIDEGVERDDHLCRVIREEGNDQLALSVDNARETKNCEHVVKNREVEGKAHW